VIALQETGTIHQVLLPGRSGLQETFHHWAVTAVQGVLLLLTGHLGLLGPFTGEQINPTSIG